MTFHIPQRLRRLRATRSTRELFRETHLSPTDFILPVFVNDSITQRTEIESMPGVYNHPESELVSFLSTAFDAGIRAALLFGVTSKKDSTGSESLRHDGLMGRMISTAKKHVPEMTIFADACFCEYTDHGHCGVVEDGNVKNDATLTNLQTQAIVAGECGADFIAPSGMLDGQVAAIRTALDSAGLHQTGIMSYSTKFCSSFYGPFRDAVGSTFKGNRATHQLDPANGRQAILESLIDEAEFADVLMVKPGIAYLDILSRLRSTSLLPIAAYQVSGEYSMIKFAVNAGALHEESVVLEMLTSFKRAGADLIITYFAVDAAKWLSSR